jgi:hypothetical protein
MVPKAQKFPSTCPKFGVPVFDEGYKLPNAVEKMAPEVRASVAPYDEKSLGHLLRNSFERTDETGLTDGPGMPEQSVCKAIMSWDEQAWLFCRFLLRKAHRPLILQASVCD